MESPAPPPRDTSVDIAKGIGILFVIGAHCDFYVVQDIPAISFIIPFFFFVSGFYLNFSHSGKIFLQKKFFSLILPFALYYVSFGIITYLLHFINITWSVPRLSDVFTLQNMLVAPFIGPIIFHMAIPLWFILSLFCSLCLMFAVGKQLIARGWNKTGPVAFVCYALILFFIYYGLIYAVELFPPVHSFPQYVIRVGVGAVYCALGYLYYKTPLANYAKTTLILGALVYAYLTVKYGYCMTNMIAQDYGTGNSKVFSLGYILSATLMLLSAAKLIASDDSKLNAALIFLGKNSFHIMALHLCGFFVLNIAGAALSSSLTMGTIPKVNFLLPRITWLYFVASLIFSIAVIKCFEYIQKFWARYRG